MALPSDFSYTRYLAAKKSVDDRALNRQVFEALAQTMKFRQAEGPVAILEVGGGIGTMVERLWDWGVLTQADYTVVDLRPENIAAAKKRLSLFARTQGLQVEENGKTSAVFSDAGRTLRLTLEAVDVYDFAARKAGKSAWDVLIAHAFLDLVDLETAIPSLFSLLKPAGCFYFTLNFDGATIFLPPLKAELDALIEKLYHATMDDRRSGGRPSGASHTGRLLFNLLPRFGGRIVAAGSSDWVVFPGPGGYTKDEAYFLHYLIYTVSQALQGKVHLEKDALREWTDQRQQQVDQGELTYIAHQLDFFGIKDR
uniref:Class I SAM-dependent methyltransferase n=1 Tax=Desulfobacca acetoxidans TaxID=60893 RepID=A0A7C3Z8M3_9BACT